MSVGLIKYYQAFLAGQEFLNDIGINLFPFDVRALATLIEDYLDITILLIPLSEYQKFSKDPIFIKDGRCIFRPEIDCFTIIYNNEQPKNRIRFTIMHEYAHILLGHLSNEITELDRGGLPDWKYYRYEGQSNTFAGNSLAPPILIREGLNNSKFNYEFIQSIFDISYEATQRREKDYSAWLSEKKPHVEELKLHKRCCGLVHINYCPTCKHQFISKEAIYCPICGQHGLWKLRRTDYMKYSFIEVDNNSKVKICPRCSNEEFGDGDYCKICGLHIVNRCADEQYCGELADGDARFCHKCGSRTTFLFNELLTPWDVEQAEAMAESNFDPFATDSKDKVIDEDLPF